MVGGWREGDGQSAGRMDKIDLKTSSEVWKEGERVTKGREHER